MVATKSVDFRKGAEGLAARVREAMGSIRSTARSMSSAPSARVGSSLSIGVELWPCIGVQFWTPITSLTESILQAERHVALHSVLEGRRQYRADPSHRQGAATRFAHRAVTDETIMVDRIGDRVAQRSLAYYQAIGDRLAVAGERP